jgi:hypothetical protein
MMMVVVVVVVVKMMMMMMMMQWYEIVWSELHELKWTRIQFTQEFLV